MSRILTINLAENAHDFMESAIQYTKSDKPLNWKYAIIHLAIALELLMKSILEKEHWSFIFDDIDNASKRHLNSGDFKSVDFENALKRLKELAGITLEERDRKYLRKIRQIRNKLTHFSISINIDELKSIVARGINIFIKLYQEYSDSDAEEYIFSLNNDLKEFDRYVSLRLAELRPILGSSDRPPWQFTSCPSCWQNSLIINDSMVACLFCGNQFTFQELAEYSEDICGRCPDCEIGYLGLILYNNEDGEYICTRCGFTSEYCYNKECGRCGEIYWDEEGSPMCPNCWQITLEQMD